MVNMEFDKLGDAPKGWRLIFRALGHRNYRLFFGGQGISLIGTWMQQTAMSWLVYHRTNSAFLLGLVAFSGQIPALFLMPVAGVLTDRWNRHRILVITQFLAMVQACILAFLDLTGALNLPQILFLSFFLGLVNAFDMPTRQAFVVDLVARREDVGNAIALNSFIFNGARLLGPSLGGFLIFLLGEAACFLLNGLSFLAVLAALLAMKIPAGKGKAFRSPLRAQLKEGFTYALGFPPIRSILLFLSLISLVGMGYVTLMPIFAKDILHGGPDTLGFLMAASGLGALMGAIFLASRKSVRGLGRMIALASFIFGLGILIFSLSRIFLVSFLILVFAGFGMMVQMASSNTILQTIVDDDKRGRVMSLFTLSFMGMAPLGSLLAGSFAHWIGAPFTLLAAGVLCLGASFSFLWRLPRLRAMIRPIYVQKGILSNTPQ
jgi:MFS family permease